MVSRLPIFHQSEGSLFTKASRADRLNVPTQPLWQVEALHLLVAASYATPRLPALVVALDLTSGTRRVWLYTWLGSDSALAASTGSSFALLNDGRV